MGMNYRLTPSVSGAKIHVQLHHGRTSDATRLTTNANL